MNEIEQKVLLMLNGIQDERGLVHITEVNRKYLLEEALCRAIEQHEAYKQKVSDAVAHWKDTSEYSSFEMMLKIAEQDLFGFIIPTPKPDPLVAVLGDLEWYNNSPQCAAELRAALDARGLEIRSKNDD
jgi:hypothetical protein